jgi:hypothetical protein
MKSRRLERRKSNTGKSADRAHTGWLLFWKYFYNGDNRKIKSEKNTPQKGMFF